MALATFGMTNLFVYCYFGKMTTDSYSKMSDCVYFELDWREFPSKLQKYLVFMIQNMQKKIYYHGFDVAVMDLRTFIGVSRVTKFRWAI